MHETMGSLGNGGTLTHAAVHVSEVIFFKIRGDDGTCYAYHFFHSRLWTARITYSQRLLILFHYRQHFTYRLSTYRQINLLDIVTYRKLYKNR